MGLVDEFLEVIDGAVVWANRLVVLHIVAMIAVRREHWHQPQDAHLDVVIRIRIAIVEVIVQFGRDALDVPNSAPKAWLPRSHCWLLEGLQSQTPQT